MIYEFQFTQGLAVGVQSLLSTGVTPEKMSVTQSMIYDFQFTQGLAVEVQSLLSTGVPPDKCLLHSQ